MNLLHKFNIYSSHKYHWRFISTTVMIINHKSSDNKAINVFKKKKNKAINMQRKDMVSK